MQTVSWALVLLLLGVPAVVAQECPGCHDAAEDGEESKEERKAAQKAAKEARAEAKEERKAAEQAVKEARAEAKEERKAAEKAAKEPAKSSRPEAKAAAQSIPASASPAVAHQSSEPVTVGSTSAPSGHPEPPHLDANMSAPENSTRIDPVGDDVHTSSPGPTRSSSSRGATVVPPQLIVLLPVAVLDVDEVGGGHAFVLDASRSFSELAPIVQYRFDGPGIDAGWQDAARVTWMPPDGSSTVWLTVRDALGQEASTAVKVNVAGSMDQAAAAASPFAWVLVLGAALTRLRW